MTDGRADDRSGELAGFHELKGIGPATAARLHQAGVLTWQSLADVAGALSAVRGVSAEALRSLSRHAAEHHRDAIGDGTGDDHNAAHRREAFVVRLSLGTDGAATRTGVVHVGSQREQQWPGWAAAELVRFVESVSDIVGIGTDPGMRLAGTDDAPSRSTDSAVAAPADAAVLQLVDRLAGRRPTGHDTDERGEAGPVAAAAPGTTAPSPGGATAAVVLPAGKLIGGTRRAVDVEVPAGCLHRGGEGAAVRYRARLRCRAFGTGGVAVPQPMAELSGSCAPAESLVLSFADVDLPAGVQLLDVTLEVDDGARAPRPSDLRRR